MPLAGASAHREDRGLRDAVPLDDVAQRAHDRSDIAGGEEIDLVEHDEGHFGVTRVRRDELRVEHLVGVLLRVDDPEQRIHLPGKPLGDRPIRALDRVEVGQVEQHELLRARIDRVFAQHAFANLEPVQQVDRTLGLPADRERLGGGRPSHVRAGDVIAHERIHEAGLARASRPEDTDDRGGGRSLRRCSAWCSSRSASATRSASIRLLTGGAERAHGREPRIQVRRHDASAARRTSSASASDSRRSDSGWSRTASAAGRP